MIAGIKKRFNIRRNIDSEFAATTSVGSLFQMSGAATAKARLPSVDSFTCGTTTVHEAVGVGRAEWSSSWQIVDADQRTKAAWYVAM